VLPVIDLSARLGWQVTDASSRHAIIVTQCAARRAG
jgi:purine-binding chemotaxis protein CheW